MSSNRKILTETRAGQIKRVHRVYTYASLIACTQRTREYVTVCGRTRRRCSHFLFVLDLFLSLRCFFHASSTLFQALSRFPFPRQPVLPPLPLSLSYSLLLVRIRFILSCVLSPLRFRSNSVGQPLFLLS